MDWRTIRVTAHVTLDMEIAPHEEFQDAVNKAEDWLAKHAPDVDYVIDDWIEDVTPEPEPPDEYKYRLEQAATDYENDDYWSD